MIPKCSNLVQEMTLGCPRRDMVWELKGQRSKSQGQSVHSILHIRTAIHRHSLGGETSRWRGIELCECFLVITSLVIKSYQKLETKTKTLSLLLESRDYQKILNKNRYYIRPTS